jgi:acyl carrier protein
MSETKTETLLTGCFEAVFPELLRQDIPAASVELLPEWDSLATVTLMSLIEEEFQITISADELEMFESYSRIRELIMGKLPAA